MSPRVVPSLLLAALPLMGLALTALPPSAEAQGVRPATLALTRALERAHPSERTDHRVVTQTDAADFATIVTARFEPPLYPGSGVYTVLVGADGRSHGQHGEHDLAELVRAVGWLRAAPSAATFLRALNAAHFNGMLAHRVPPTLSLERGVLHFSVRRADPMRGDEVERIDVEIGPRGAMTLVRTPIQSETTTTPARDLLRQAGTGRGVDALELMAALRALEGEPDPELRGWLAAISAVESASDAIPGEAIRAIGDSDAAAETLRARWSTLPATRRAALIELAGVYQSPGFRARVAR